MSEEKDFIAVIFIGAGSEYFRCGDPIEAATKCLRGLKLNWRHLFCLSATKTWRVNVWEVTGRDSVYWDLSGLYDSATNEKIDTHRIVEVFG